jgi:O-antigen/teichoic acid export membrane protein
MGYGRQYFGHVLIASAGSVGVGALFYFLRILLYARLGVEQYALFYAAFSLGTLMCPLLCFGFEPGVVPHITRFREDGDWGAVKSLILSTLVPQGFMALALVGLVWVFGEPLAAFLFPASKYGLPVAETVGVLRIVAAFIGVVVLFRWTLSLLLGLQLIAAWNLAEVLYGFGCLGVTLALLRSGWDTRGPATGYLAGASVGLAAAGLMALFGAPHVWRAPFAWRPDLVRLVFAEGKYLSVALGGIIVFSQMDTVMLTALLRDPAPVAAYQLAVPTLMILYAVIGATARAFLPLATRLAHRGERELLAAGLADIYDTAAVVLLPGSVAVACFSDVLMAALFRRNLLDSPDAFNILAPGCFFFFTTAFNLQVLAALGRARAAAAAVSIALGVNLVLNIALIPPLGIRGAATATVLSHAVATLVGMRAITRDLSMPGRAKAGIASVIACAAIVPAALWFRGTALYLGNPYVAAPLAAATLAGLAVIALEAAGAAPLRRMARAVM